MIRPLLWGTILSIYLLFPARNQGLDAVNYALMIEKETPSALFHPHHLLYNSLGRLLLNIAVSGNWQIPVLHLLGTLSSIFGISGIILFTITISNLTRKKVLTLIIPLFLAFSYSYWYSSLNAESYIIALFFLMICLYLLIKLDHSFRWHLIFFLAIAHSLATLFHQTHILFLMPVSFILYQKGGIKTAAWYSSLFFLVVGSAYLLAGYLTQNLSSLKSFFEWITLYAHGNALPLAIFTLQTYHRPLLLWPELSCMEAI